MLRSGIPLVLEGATATGKVAMARKLHSHASNAHGEPMVIDCPTIGLDAFKAQIGHSHDANPEL